MDKPTERQLDANTADGHTSTVNDDRDESETNAASAVEARETDVARTRAGVESWSDVDSASNNQQLTATQLLSQLNPTLPSQGRLHALAKYVQTLQDRIAGHVVDVQLRPALGLFWLLGVDSLSLRQLTLGLDLLYSVLAAYCITLWLANEIANVEHIYLSAVRLLRPKMISWGLIREDDTFSNRLRNFNGVLVDTTRYYHLEILCRYGDYLAERLKIFRQHISRRYPEGKHLVDLWTETAQTLRREEKTKAKPCHDLVEAAAKDLHWDEQNTLFMIHEYGKRNNLMHAELFQLIRKEDWTAVAERCDKDVDKLRNLFVAPDEDDIDHWERIIKDFRDCWVHKPDGTSWEPQPVIQQALDQGTRDPFVLYELSLKHRAKQAVADSETVQSETGLSNKELQAKLHRLQEALDSSGTPEATVKLIEDKNAKIETLNKENEKLQRSIEKLRLSVKQAYRDRTEEDGGNDGNNEGSKDGHDKDDEDAPKSDDDSDEDTLLGGLF